MSTRDQTNRDQSYDRTRSKSSERLEQPVTNRGQKYVSTACDACKKARRKCDEKRPCRACLDAKRECTFEKGNDGRRGRKRTLDELHAKLDAYDAIFGSLRSSDRKTSEEVFQMIQSPASMGDVAEHAKKLLEGQTPGSSNLPKPDLRGVMSIASLTDKPLITVPAKPWTSVTDDDEAVSHLISVFFTWQYSVHPTLIERVFVREMKSGSLSSRFCSPLLVNALLLVACMFTDHPCAFSVPNDSSSRGVHFREEAMRLFALEEGKTSLATVQAMPSLCFGIILSGKDRVGHLYVGNMISLTADLRAQIRKSLKQGNNEFLNNDYQKSFTLAMWGCFTSSVEVAVAWQKPFTLELPKVKPPFRESDLRQLSTWYPYPSLSSGVDVALYGIINEHFRLSSIAADILPLVLGNEEEQQPREVKIESQASFDRNETMSLSRMLDVSRRLSSWYRELPPYAKLEFTEKTTISGPLLDLHLSYHSRQVILHMQGLHHKHSSAAHKEEAGESLVANCRTIAKCIEWFQRSFGLTHFSCTLSHAATVAVYGLLDFLSHESVPDMFEVLISALTAVSRRWNVARGVMKMIWIILHERNDAHHLNDATIRLLRLEAVDSWKLKDYELFEQCIYPNYATVLEKGRELADMGELFSQYARFELGDLL